MLERLVECSKKFAARVDKLCEIYSKTTDPVIKNQDHTPELTLLLDDIQECLTSMGVCRCLEIKKRKKNKKDAMPQSMEEFNKQQAAAIAALEKKKKETWDEREDEKKPWKDKEAKDIAESLYLCHASLQNYCVTYFDPLALQLMGDVPKNFSRFQYTKTLHMLLIFKSTFLSCLIYVSDYCVENTEKWVLDRLYDIRDTKGHKDFYRDYYFEQPIKQDFNKTYEEEEEEENKEEEDIFDKKRKEALKNQQVHQQTNLEEASKRDMWHQLFWNCMTFSAQILPRSSLQDKLLLIIDKIYPYLVLRSMQRIPVLSFQFPKGPLAELPSPEDICTLVFFWQRKIHYTRAVLDHLAVREIFFRKGYRDVYMKQKPGCEISHDILTSRKKRVWKEAIRNMSTGVLVNYRIQDLKDHIYMCLIPPGLYDAYGHIHPTFISNYVGIGERVLNRHVMKHSTAFFACKMGDIMEGYIRPSLVSPQASVRLKDIKDSDSESEEEDYDEKGSLVPGMFTDDIMYRRVCIILFMFLLDRICLESINQKYLEDHVFYEPDFGALLIVPLGIGIICGSFYLSTPDGKLIHMPEDPPAFADIYLRYMRQCKGEIYETILKRFANTHSDLADQ